MTYGHILLSILIILTYTPWTYIVIKDFKRLIFNNYDLDDMKPYSFIWIIITAIFIGAIIISIWEIPINI